MLLVHLFVFKAFLGVGCLFLQHSPQLALDVQLLLRQGQQLRVRGLARGRHGSCTDAFGVHVNSINGYQRAPARLRSHARSQQASTRSRWLRNNSSLHRRHLLVKCAFIAVNIISCLYKLVVDLAAIFAKGR